MSCIYGTWVNEKTCPVCGKTFIVHSENWAYKFRTGNHFTHVCSWHCYRVQERINEQKRRSRKPINRAILCGKGEEIKSLLTAGIRPTEICRRLEVSYATINYWKSKMKAEEEAV